MRIAAIDQGTTSTRVLVASDGAPPDVRCAIRHEQLLPAAGWVEHRPDELLANIVACLAAADDADLIGLTNQGESCLAWDRETGEPVSPLIVWQDNRTSADVDALKREGAEAISRERAGLPLDPYFSASKLGWILRRCPAAQNAARAGRLRLGTTDAFFLDRLAGTFATDPSTASRTGLMNIRSLQWDAELCRLFGVPIEALPEIRPTLGGFGTIGRRPVVASLVDQQAALFGHGCRAAGDVKVTFGTGAFVLAVSGGAGAASPAGGLLPTVAWQLGRDTTYALEGGVYDAGAAVEWAQRAGIIHDIAELADFDASPAIERGLAFVPALSGLACPHWDRSAAALWIGMDAATTRRDLGQALIEGIALRTAEVVDAMEREIGGISRLSVDGGLSRSAYLVHFLADVLGRDVVVHPFEELTAFGCAGLVAQSEAVRLAGPLEPSVTVAPSGTLSRRSRATFERAVERARTWRAF